ncbi:uncharacterized protein LOC119776874 isoform X2 [Cyprinodon tularosa]|uniref:uncharacterized protein LOC119776874 isoform X2 n=1 Tax=Cyprinodon tularosa TaxID=77115 RepID=UPI0018E1FB76|nr:uncharacterized protein LOC119776874 isoform X2 [Cyprinodon tularosa]
MKLVLFFMLSLLCCLASVIVKQEGQTATFHAKTTVHVFSYRWNFTQNNETEEVIRVEEGIIKFKGTRFKNRLQTNVKTASITISNLILNDNGTFTGCITTDKGQIYPNVSLFVTGNDLLTYNCQLGHNVTLKSGLQTTEMGHSANWTNGSDFNGKEFASFQNSVIRYGDGFNNFFLNKTNLDLTIIQVTNNQRGFYCSELKMNNYLHIGRKHQVIVYDPVSTPNITNVAQPARRFCAAKCSVKNGPDLNLTWYYGDIIISNISNPNISILTLQIEIQREDISNYSCRAQNSVSLEMTPLSLVWHPCHSSTTSAALTKTRNHELQNLASCQDPDEHLENLEGRNYGSANPTNQT